MREKATMSILFFCLKFLTFQLARQAQCFSIFYQRKYGASGLTAVLPTWAHTINSAAKVRNSFYPCKKKTGKFTHGQ